MVEPLVVTEVDLARVHGRHGEASADGDEEHARGHEHHRRHRQPPVGQLHAQQQTAAQEHGVEDGIEQRRIGHHEQHPAYGRPHTDAGQAVAGRRKEVEDGRGVQPETPVAIEYGIGHRDDRHQHGHEDEVAAPHAVQPPPQRPGGCHEEQAGQGREVTRQREVERQAVPHDPQPVGPCHVGIERRMYRHEQRFLYHKQEDKQHVGPDQADETFFHCFFFRFGVTG